MLTILFYLLAIIFLPVNLCAKKFGRVLVYSGMVLGALTMFYLNGSLPDWTIFHLLVGLGSPLSKVCLFLANHLTALILGLPIELLGNAHWIVKLLCFFPICYVILFLTFVSSFAGAPELMILIIAGNFLWKKYHEPLSMEALRASDHVSNPNQKITAMPSGVVRVEEPHLTSFYIPEGTEVHPIWPKGSDDDEQ